MTEKIDKINDIIEAILTKLKNNYERVEKKVIEASKDLDENASSGEYEALALLKKEAIINRALYLYYSQELKKVMNGSYDSISKSILINATSNEKGDSQNSINKIDLEDLCKGVTSSAVTNEVLNSLEIFSGSDVSPKKISNSNNGNNHRTKIAYEDEKIEYKIEETDDEFVLKMVGSNVEPPSEEEMRAGSNVEPLSDDEMKACSSVEPISEEEMNAGSDVEPLSDDEMKACSSVEPLSEEEMNAGSDVEPLSDEEMNAGSSVSSKNKKVH